MMKKILKYTLFAFGFALLFASCEKTQTIYPANIPEEGIYIFGSSIFTDSVNLNGVMDAGSVLDNDGNIVKRDSMFQKFMFVKASGDFSVGQQIGDELVTYGLSGSWSEDDVNVWSGDVIENGTNFTAPDDGFYMFIIDLNLSKAFLFKVSDWYLVSDRFLSDNPVMTLVSAGDTGAVWRADNQMMSQGKGDLSFRFYSQDTYNLTDSIQFVTTLAGAYNKLTFGGPALKVEFPEDVTCFFQLSYNVETGFSFKDNMPIIDPRGHVYSMIGDAFFIDNDPNGTPTAWNIDFDLVFDTASDTLNNVYEFKLNGIYFRENREFKIRLDHIWDNGEMGYSGVDVITGDPSNILNAGGQYGNFKTIAEKKYDITLIFDAKNRIRTLDLTSVQ